MNYRFADQTGISFWLRQCMRTVVIGGLCGALLVFGTTVHAFTVTQSTDSGQLESALTSGHNAGITITDFTITHGYADSTGYISNSSNPTYGISSGLVLSTGKVTDYSTGPNNNSGGLTTVLDNAPYSSADNLLNQITGTHLYDSTPYPYDHYDVTQIDITFDLKKDFDMVVFNAVFGSEEHPLYDLTDFRDAFGVFLNGNLIASATTALTLSSLPGTELNGVLTPNNNPLLTFSGVTGDKVTGSTDNKLTIILSDTSDANLDTTVYLNGLNASATPEPTTYLLLGIGLGAVAVVRRLHRPK